MRNKTGTAALLAAAVLAAPLVEAQDNPSSQSSEGQEVTGEDIDYLQQRIDEISALLNTVKPGKRRFLLTGYGFGGFENAEGDNSSFFAGFNPIFLWTPTDRILFEAEVELELEDSGTNTALEYAQLSYVLSDEVILGVGKFLNPANVFQERLHPAWINKLPDKPLAFSSKRIQASTQLGVQVHGAVPVGSTKMNYAVYVSNGPTLATDAPGSFGQLKFKDFEDGNNSKAVGGRIGVFLAPELEVGASLEETSNVTPDASAVADAEALIYSFDVNYTGSVPGGTLDGRAQWIFSDVDDVTFDPSGSVGFGPRKLDNSRDGGYVQVAYRPSDSQSPILSKLEGVARYDSVNLPAGAPEGGDESRVTFGVNFWSTASSVFKVAYQIDNQDGAPDSDAVMFEWALGF